MKFVLIFIISLFLCKSIIAQEYTAEYWLQKGDEFYNDSSFDLALRCYEKAIEIDPQKADAWNNKGNVLTELNRTKEANTAFAKANELTTSDEYDKSSAVGADISSSIEDGSADYMKTIYVSKEGYDGIEIYFILADKNGVSIASDGKMDLSITDEDTGRSLFSLSRYVTKQDFRVATLGLGAFEHRAVILDIGRISYSEMRNVPNGEYDRGKVKIKFTTPTNKILSGMETVYFN